MSEEAKKPTHSLTFMMRNNPERKGQIGAGWINPDGSINIKLNTLVVLAENPDMIIKLWPFDEKKAKEYNASKKAKTGEASPEQASTQRPF